MSSRDMTATLATFIQKIIGGGTPARSVQSNWKGSIPWASVKDLEQGKIALEDTREHISERALHDSAANLIPPGVPIVCTRMAVGRSAMPSIYVAINQDLKALFPSPDVDARYLLRGLDYLQSKFEAVATGSTVKGLQVHELLKFRLFKPSISEQQEIAEILDTLDDQILLTGRIISKLEVTGRGLLENLLSRGIDEAGRLREVENFETRIGDSGSFPAKWEVARLDQIAEVERGKFGHRPRNDPHYLTGPFPFIQTGDVAAAAGRVILNASQSLNHRGAAVSREFTTGTIAVTIAANIADTAILGRPMYFPDSVVGVAVHAPHVTEYVEFIVRGIYNSQGEAET